MRLPQDASSFRVNWSIFCLCEAQQLTTRNGPVWTQLEVLTVFLSLTKEICISIVTNPLKIINHLQSMTITSDQSVLRCSNQNSKFFHFISATNLMVKWVVDRTPTSHDLLEATKDINYLKSSPQGDERLKGIFVQLQHTSNTRYQFEQLKKGSYSSWFGAVSCIYTCNLCMSILRRSAI